MTKPDVTSLILAGSKLKADLLEVFTSLSLDYGTEVISELAMGVRDEKGVLASNGFAKTGTSVVYGGAPWEVSQFDTDLSGGGAAYTLRARSKLGRGLRKTYKVRGDRSVSPSGWVADRVRAYGGKAITQTSAKRTIITQRGGDEAQSELEVMKGLASDLGWSWVEFDATLIFGAKAWALAGGPGRPTWGVTWIKDTRYDAMSLSGSRSDDNRESAGSLSLTLPHDYGKKVRPWDRLQLGAGTGALAGTWLVDSVKFDADGVSPVSIEASLPRGPFPKRGSTATR